MAFSAGGDGGRRSPEYLAVQFAKRLFAAACDCRLTNGCAWNAVSAFANCGRAVAYVRCSADQGHHCHVPEPDRQEA